MAVMFPLKIINVLIVVINKLENRIIKLHIINVYEQLENYLNEFIKEHPNIGDKSKKKIKKII